MPSFNEIMALIGKFVIIALYGLTLIKFNNARRVDGTLKLRFNTRSWVEVIAVGIINVIAIVIPVNKDNVVWLSVYIFAALLITTFHTRRIAAYGKKVIFILEHAFLAKDITRAKYEKGLLTFLIKGRPFKLRLPLADTDLLLEKLSGRSPRK